MKSLAVPSFLALGIATFACASAHAATLIIPVNAGDGEIGSTVVGDGGGSPSNQTKNGTILPGAYNSTMISVIFPFQLPVLEPGETIESVNLAFTAARVGGTLSFNADLYGLSFRSTNAYTGADYFVGALDTTDATLLQDNILTTTAPTSDTRTNTDDSADEALRAYIQAQYTAGAVGGEYIYLRFSPDYTTLPAGSASRGFAIKTQETGAATQAVLTIVTVPEPGVSLGLLGGLTALAGFQRRRRAC